MLDNNNLLLNISQDSSFSNQKSLFFFSKIKLFLFTCSGFRLMLHADFFSTNDALDHYTRGIARNCPHFCSVVFFSFWSRWLPLFAGFICLALYQWILLPPSLLCDFQSLHGLWGQICWSLICFPLLVYFSLFVLSTSFLCSSKRLFNSLPVSPLCWLNLDVVSPVKVGG